MIAIDIDLELVHVGNLQDGRDDKDNSEKNFKDGFDGVFHKTRRTTIE